MQMCVCLGIYLSALSGRLLLAAEQSDPSVLGHATDCEGSSTGTLKIKEVSIINAQGFIYRWELQGRFHLIKILLLCMSQLVYWLQQQYWPHPFPKYLIWVTPTF